MKVNGIDERVVWGRAHRADFIVFIYESESADETNGSWSIDSYLLSDADLPAVFTWLGANLPQGCCWSLGVVRESVVPGHESLKTVSWVVGADVLNVPAQSREP